MFKEELFGYFPGRYFGRLGFVREQKLEKENLIKFKYTPYTIKKKKLKEWKEGEAIFEVSLSFEKSKTIKVPTNAFYSKDGNILLHYDPLSNRQWLTVQELGGIKYLRNYGDLKDSYRTIRQALENFKYTSVEKDQTIKAIKDKLDYLQSELNMLRPANEMLIDQLSDIRNSNIDLIKRLEHFKRKAESYEGMYKESKEMVDVLVTMAASLKNVAAAHAEQINTFYDALTGRRVAKADELAQEVEKYRAEVSKMKDKMEEAFTKLDKLSEKEGKIEKEEVEKIARSRTEGGIEETS